MAEKETPEGVLTADPKTGVTPDSYEDPNTAWLNSQDVFLSDETPSWS